MYISNKMIDDITICKTIDEKVSTYENFFNSDIPVLVVLGEGGSGKSYALKLVKKHGRVILMLDGGMIMFDPKGLDDEDGVSDACIVYHLNESEADIDLAKALQKKYEAHVVRFLHEEAGLNR